MTNSPALQLSVVTSWCCVSPCPAGLPGPHWWGAVVQHQYDLCHWHTWGQSSHPEEHNETKQYCHSDEHGKDNWKVCTCCKVLANYMRQSITLILKTCIHISHSLVQPSFQYYLLWTVWWFTYYHVLQFEFELVNMWSKSDDEEDASMKAVGKCCGTNWRQHGMAPLWHTILIF